MDFLLRLGCLLLLWNIASNFGVTAGVVSTGVTKGDPIADTQNNLLGAQIEIISIGTAESLEEIKDHLSILGEELQKLNKLSDLRREYDNNVLIAIQALTKQYNSIESQLRSLQIAVNERADLGDQRAILKDVIDAVNGSKFKLADEKLIQLGDIALIPKIVHEVYSEENVDLLVNFAKSISKITPTYEVLKSLYEEMKTNNNQNPIKLITVAEALESEVVSQHNDPDEIKTSAEAIVDNLVDVIEDAALEFLVKAMKKPCGYKTRGDVHTLTDALYDFRPEVSDNVMQGLVDETYGTVATNTILDNISSHGSTAQAISGINALFWKLKTDEKCNSAALLNLASSLSKQQKRSEFATLDEERKSAVDKVVKSIPTCARNLFFNSSSVCLWNKARDTYLIAADSSLNHDSERRNIFTYSPSINSSISSNSSILEDVPRGAAWIPKKIGDKILFKSVDYYSEYLYVAAFDYNPEMRYVFNWIQGGNTDDQSAFTVELDGDHCYLKSTHFNEYLFASEVKYKTNESYSYVFTWKPGTSGGNSDFVWQIRSC